MIAMADCERTGAGHREVVVAATDRDFCDVGALWDQYDAWVAANTGRRLREAQPDFAGDRSRPRDEFAVPGAVLVGRVDRRPAGVVGLRSLGADVGLTRFFVGGAARGTGLGRALLDHAIAFSWLQGFGAIRLETVPAHMPVAAAMYERAGFIETSRRTHVGLEAVTMTLLLEQPDRTTFDVGLLAECAPVAPAAATAREES